MIGAQTTAIYSACSAVPCLSDAANVACSAGADANAAVSPDIARVIDDGSGDGRAELIRMEHRMMRQTRGLLSSIYSVKFASIENPYRKVDFLKHVTYFLRIGAFRCLRLSPSARAVATEFTSGKVEELMGHIAPGIPLFEIDREVAALLSPSVEDMTRHEKAMVEKGIRIGEMMRLAGSVHLTYARRVAYCRFLEGAGSDEYLFNLVVLRAMAAARRMVKADDGSGHADAIEFLTELGNDHGMQATRHADIFFGVIDTHERRIKGLAELKVDPERLSSARQRYIDGLEEDFLGMYTVTSALFMQLSRYAELFELTELSKYLSDRHAQERMMAQRLGLEQ